MWEDSRKMLKSFDTNMLNRTYPDICPECGSSEKHVFFYRFDEDDSDGGVWMWCSKCHSYTHAHSVVPKIWKNPVFIDEEKLDDTIDYLEANKDKIDKWIEELKQ